MKDDYTTNSHYLRMKLLKLPCRCRQNALLATISEKDANIALLELSPTSGSDREVRQLKAEKDELVTELKEQVRRWTGPIPVPRLFSLPACPGSFPYPRVQALFSHPRAQALFPTLVPRLFSPPSCPGSFPFPRAQALISSAVIKNAIISDAINPITFQCPDIFLRHG